MKNENIIAFRKLTEVDFNNMYKWLNTDFVTEWYEKGGSSLEKIKNKFLPRINGEEPIHAYIIICNGSDIGYIQTYNIGDFPDYSQYVDCSDNASGIDLFIGEEAYIHKGLGKEILSNFLAKYVFTLTGSTCCIIGPEPDNKVAIRAYEKAGFVYLKTIHIPGEDNEEYLMRYDQPFK